MAVPQCLFMTMTILKLIDMVKYRGIRESILDKNMLLDYNHNMKIKIILILIFIVILMSCHKRSISTQNAENLILDNSDEILKEQNIETEYFKIFYEIDRIMTINDIPEEYIGKYYFSGMNNPEKINDFINDNNKQKKEINITDLENSYIEIKSDDDDKVFVVASEELWDTLLYWDKFEGGRFIYTKDLKNEDGFYGRAGDSFEQSMNMKYYFEENMTLVVYIELINHKEIIEDKKENVYIFYFLKQNT